MTAPTPDFVERMQRIATLIATSHPDSRVRQLMADEEIEVRARPGRRDYAKVGGKQGGDGVLVGYHEVGHFGGSPRITTFETGIKTLAATRGISVDDAIHQHLVHEIGHAAGGCPDGHYDCTVDEVMQTIALGGHLEPDQLTVYAPMLSSADAQHVRTSPWLTDALVPVAAQTVRRPG